MTRFHSNEALFQAVRDLIAALEAEGHHQAAVELKGGLGCLTGLTDGWALFLESIEKVQTAGSQRCAQEHQQSLEAIRAAVHAALYGR